jgi:excinuclease ABC subunit C
VPDDPDRPIADAEGLLPSSTPPPWGTETREVRLARLLRSARNLPALPGVYLMKDHTGVVLYVGKALRLRDRVASYFQPATDLGFKKQPMLELIHSFDTIEFEGEWEALMAENRLIKDIGPRYNARLTDDKTYPYLVITGKEDFPRVYVTRDLSDPLVRAGRVIGPFASAGTLRHAVTVLQRVFRFRTCSLDIVAGDPKNLFFRPCLLYNIGQCTGPCASKIGKENYRIDVDRFVRFIESKRSVMLRQLREEMEQASAALEFERAAVLRDQIRAIERLDERVRKRALSRSRGGASDDGDTWQPEAEGLSVVGLSQGAGTGTKGELRSSGPRGVGFIDPKRGLNSLQKTLGMALPIRCIEAIDIAHLQGGETVGSKVCFIDGRPFKNAYRRYRITGSERRGLGQPTPGELNDDYGSIREVVLRRYREAGAGQELYPDVILIDGGLGQLHAALDAFKELDVKPPMVISLAKKDELVYMQERSGPIKLGRENFGLRLCQAIRDEAHRFAQHYHHILRRRKTLEEP